MEIERIYTSDKRGEEQKREYEAGDSMVREEPVREVVKCQKRHRIFKKR